MNSILLTVCGGAACVACIVAGLVLLPDDPGTSMALVLAGVAAHSAMIVLDLRSTAVFGRARVVRDEVSPMYRMLAGRLGLAAGGACMWGIDYVLVWALLPLLVDTEWPDPRASGMFLLVFAAIHAFGWLSNRSLARRPA